MGDDSYRLYNTDKEIPTFQVSFYFIKSTIIIGIV